MHRRFLLRLAAVVAALGFTPAALATTGAMNLTASTVGWTAVATFVLAYAIVISEEFTELRKSKPVIIGAGIIWVLVALAYAQYGQGETAAHLLRTNLLEYAELMLFLLSAMTFINTLEERNVFKTLRSWLIASGYSLRTIFWLTGVLAFFVSAVADNLTTALLMAAVVMAVGHGNKKFVVVSCINLVVAANAGGAFSPFGDITTLMVWQKGVVKFGEFFGLFLPSFVNWLVPAFFMSFAVSKGRPTASGEHTPVKPGGYAIIALFVFTIVLTVSLHQYLHLPPFLGMMTGLGLLKVHGYFIRRRELEAEPEAEVTPPDGYKRSAKPFDIFVSIKRVEWDTLMFFYGVVLCVGGLGALGYLAGLSQALYHGLGATHANVAIGVASAVIDNIPIMYAVLTMNPDMPLGQWLLVTMTAGVGGSLLSIGSAAGAGLMGQARGVYTFFAHLRWTWAVALGYVASIWVHFLVNGATF